MAPLLSAAGAEPEAAAPEFTADVALVPRDEELRRRWRVGDDIENASATVAAICASNRWEGGEEENAPPPPWVLSPPVEVLLSPPSWSSLGEVRLLTGHGKVAHKRFEDIDTPPPVGDGPLGALPAVLSAVLSTPSAFPKTNSEMASPFPNRPQTPLARRARVTAVWTLPAPPSPAPAPAPASASTLAPAPAPAFVPDSPSPSPTPSFPSCWSICGGDVRPSGPTAFGGRSDPVSPPSSPPPPGLRPFGGIKSSPVIVSGDLRLIGGVALPPPALSPPSPPRQTPAAAAAVAPGDAVPGDIPPSAASNLTLLS